MFPTDLQFFEILECFSCFIIFDGMNPWLLDCSLLLEDSAFEMQASSHICTWDPYAYRKRIVKHVSKIRFLAKQKCKRLPHQKSSTSSDRPCT